LEAFTRLFLDEHNDPDLEEVFSLLCQIFDPECHASLLGDELDALAADAEADLEEPVKTGLGRERR
jgi:hypothetical protein